MSRCKFHQIVRIAIWCSLTACVAAGPVHAKTIVGSFDPLYGAAYPGLSFSGREVFYVPDSCLTGAFASPTFIADGAACSQGDPNGLNPSALGAWGGMSLLSATVDLFVNSVYQETLTFAAPLGTDPSHKSNLSIDPVFGVVVMTNPITQQVDVIGASTGVLGGMTTALSYLNAANNTAPRTFFLQLGLGFNNGDVDNDFAGEHDSDEFSESDAVNPAPFQKAFLFDACSGAGNLANCSGQSNAAAVTFIPAPNSLSLVFGGAAAGWLARRKRASGKTQRTD